ncbi:MAG: alanine--tRNA ligase [Saprospiraceae bacterium]|nr:alanine--tRNA ligase [Saprospiraceae bacterium]
MKSAEVRKTFLDFFKSKQHEIVQSAPMVSKDDPTLMFTNAGMNQFKDIFLGNKTEKFNRVADTQKCLRVSGKHNDLDEVGHDTYHHTMFEMLGNWSFGDYFKKEAIEWAWELLTDVYGIDKENLYITVFEGDKKDNLGVDEEALNFWKNLVTEDKILFGSKKDNFWEMGESGPCGPCSEIHIDIRDESDKKKIPGKELVNKDHPLVIEIWNLVFIEFNRMANGDLVPLPAKHVDTGMGFERLCMVLQKVKSNYDTDVFQPIIQEIAGIANKKYGENEDVDIAIRVIADHLRAISFSIADGQLPSNVKAGYVIRRILRRAVRYGYTFLDLKEPFINELVPVLVKQLGETFPELEKQKDLIKKVITEEELSFLRTLANGINLLDDIVKKTKIEKYKVVPGKIAFELYDTYGFPLDLTELILKENDLIVSRREFDQEMDAQKKRSRKDAKTETDDWIEILDDDVEEFLGYDYLDADIKITRYRKVIAQKKELYHLVFNYTPFYAKSGGQIGDTGFIESSEEKIFIIDTKKEHNTIIHITEKLPKNIQLDFKAVVNETLREAITCNHSATHLMHHALREVLGTHVEQKGSLVHYDYLRFDFAHYQKLTAEEIRNVEKIVNQNIRKNISIDEKRAIPIKKAQQMGAMSLFGEKYGDLVRVIKFDDSIELCGGTHVKATGQIGLFKIISESAIAAGIRRIEAITASKAEEFFNHQNDVITEIKNILKNPKDIVKGVQLIIEQKSLLQKQVTDLNRQMAANIKDEMFDLVEKINGINFIAHKVSLDAASIKDLAFKMKENLENLFLIIGSDDNGKASLTIIISENLVKERGLNAGKIIREIAKEINGGGGGQAHFATAGGTNPDGIINALKKAEEFVKKD